MSEHLDIETPGGFWPVDPTPCADFGDHTEDVQAYAATLAAHWLYRLTGRRYGTKPISIRPCRQDHTTASTYRGPSSSSLTNALIPTAFPTLLGLSSFGCNSCFTGDPSTLALPLTPADSISSITVDGAVTDLSGFAIFDSSLLVAPPDFSFPRTQRLDLPLTEADTWEITYTYGLPVPPDGAFAAGYLAGELARACSGAKCALPRRVQSIARQGVSIQIVDNPDFLRDGLVGLTEVDQFVVSVNPHGLHSPSKVYSPDTLHTRARRSTWTPSP